LPEGRRTRTCPRSVGYISAVERKDVEEGGGGRVGAIKFAIAEGAART